MRPLIFTALALHLASATRRDAPFLTSDGSVGSENAIINDRVYDDVFASMDGPVEITRGSVQEFDIGGSNSDFGSSQDTDSSHHSLQNQEVTPAMAMSQRAQDEIMPSIPEDQSVLNFNADNEMFDAGASSSSLSDVSLGEEESRVSSIGSNVFLPSSPDTENLLASMDQDIPPGAQIIIKQVHGMDEITKLLMDILFSQGRARRITQMLLDQSFPNINLGFGVKADFWDFQVIELSRPKTARIEFLREGIFLYLDRVRVVLELRIKASHRLIHAGGKIRVECGALSFKTLLIPEIKSLKYDDPNYRSGSSKRLTMHVRRAKLMFKEPIRPTVSESRLSWIIQWIYEQGKDTFSSAIKNIISNLLVGIIKDVVPGVVHDLVYSQTGALLNILDSLLSRNYGINLDLSQNFDYNDAYVGIGTGRFVARANLMLSHIPKTIMNDEEWRNKFLSPIPKTWPRGEALLPNQRVDLYHELQPMPMTTPAEEFTQEQMRRRREKPWYQRVRGWMARQLGKLAFWRKTPSFTEEDLDKAYVNYMEGTPSPRYNPEIQPQGSDEDSI